VSFTGERGGSAYFADKGVFRLADEEAVDDCERARRASHDEPEVVSRRVPFNSCGPHIAAEEGSETSRKRDYALCDPIRKADYLRRRHVVEEDRHRRECKRRAAVSHSRADGQGNHDDEAAAALRAGE